MKLIYPILPEGRFKTLTLSFDGTILWAGGRS